MSIAGVCPTPWIPSHHVPEECGLVSGKEGVHGLSDTDTLPDTSTMAFDDRLSRK